MITAAATRSSVAVVRRTLIKAVDQGQAVVKAGGEVQGRAYRRELSAQPVPGDLRRTVDTFLSYARPLVSADQLRHTAQLADQFLKWPGPELQTLFQKFAQERTNWMSYLGQVGQLSYRERLLDFAGSFCPAAKTVSSLDGQLWLASTIVSALLHFKWQLDNQTIETGRLGGQEQCMSSFQHAFCSCRVPAVPCDRFIVYPTSSPSTRHIIVMYNDQIFSVEVYAESGRALSTEQLYEQLKEVTQSSTSGSQPVGLLTYLPRESWAAIFKELVQDEKNSAVMVNIQRSLFVLTLDPPVPPTVTAPLPSTSTLTVTRHASDIPQLYYGGGSDFNPGNRWLDKGLQVIVGAGGAWGIQTEHIAVDGTHVAQMADYVSDFVRTSSPEGNVGIPRQQVRPPTRLRLNLTTRAVSDIGKARQLIQSPEVELEFSGFTVKGMGTEVVKNWGMSTDAFIQVALQLAYYRLHQRPSRAVEYVSKRCHHQGRLDLVHCTTPETLAFIHHMDSDDVSPRDKLRSLKKALHVHKSQVNEIRSGYSMCSHFTALKYMALQYGFEFPPLFLDPSFTLAFQFDVSSSQVRYKHDMTSCYLPEEKDGYACPYTPYDHHINFHIISCRQHLRDSSSHLMSCSIVSALRDMGQLAQFEMTVDPV